MGTAVYKENTTWSNQTALPQTRIEMSRGQNGYNYSMIGFCGSNGSYIQTLYQYNMTSWSTPVSSGLTARGNGVGAPLAANMYFAGGVDGGGTISSGNEKFNNSAIATYTDPVFTQAYAGACQLLSQQKIFFVGGITNTGTNDSTSFTKQLNQAESASAFTAPSGPRSRCCLSPLFAKAYLYGGYTSNTGGTGITESWNGSAWTTETASPLLTIVSSGSEYATPSKIGVLTGNNTSAAAVNNNQAFNGSSWSQAVVYPATSSQLNSGGF